jgi:UDPglucose 6-dehydrogenase
MNSLSVIGIGKLGICVALSFASNGYDVIGVDKNVKLIESITDNTYSSLEPNVEELLTVCKTKNSLHVTTLIQEALHNDIIFIVVPTPSLPNNEYDHSAIDNVINDILSHGIQNIQKHIIICCTTMPGYCNKINDRLKDYNYTVSYNPEFIAQGNIIYGIHNPDIILIGESSKEIGDHIEDIYSKICNNTPHICRMSITEAEIAKISINCFITTKIAFANMIGDSLIHLGYQPEKVLDAIGKDSRIGNKSLHWGYGFGGPCFPRDNRALGKFLSNNHMNGLICVATDKSNALHLDYQVKHFIENNTTESDIILDCITYKPESVLIEESQKLKFAEKLVEYGYNVTIKERKCVIEELKKTYGNLFNYREKDSVM